MVFIAVGRNCCLSPLHASKKTGILAGTIVVGGGEWVGVSGKHGRRRSPVADKTRQDKTTINSKTRQQITNHESLPFVCAIRHSRGVTCC